MSDNTRHKSHVPLFSAFLVAIAVFALCDTARCDGFRNPPAGAKALATDGGKVAFINDATAVSHNPANLVEIEGGQVLISATLVEGQTDLTTLFGKVSTDNPLIALPNIYGAYRIREASALTLGLGVTTPFGQSVEWEENEVDSYFSEMRMIAITPSLAAKVSDTLSAGIGLDIYWSDLKLHNMIRGADGMLLGKAHLEGDGASVGANAGVTWRFAENQRLALVYHAPFSVTYEGDATINAPGLPLLPVSEFEAEFDFPSSAVLGYGIQLSDTLRVAADLEWLQFSRNEAIAMDYGLNNLAGFPLSVTQDWDDTWSFGVSTEWQCLESTALRGGYKFLESPIPSATLAPSLPDADRHALTFGIGWKQDGHGIDVGYLLSLIDDRTVSGNPNPMLNGEYELTAHLVSLNYSYDF